MLQPLLTQPLLTLSPLHLAVMGITIFEVAIISFLTIYYLARPSDKNRLWYLILLIFIIINNLCGVFFPDPSLAITVKAQDAITFFIKVAMSLYFGYYFYKAFGLKDINIFNNYGSIFFIVLPYIFIFFIPALRTSSFFANNDFTNAAPFVYSIGFIYSTTMVLKSGIYKREDSHHEDFRVIISAYVALLCWALLPILIFFGDYGPHTLLATNACFLAMTVFYIRAAVAKMKEEYNTVLLSEQGLIKKVEERTVQLEQMYEARTNTFINLAHETRTPLTLINHYLDEIMAKHKSIPGMPVLKHNVQRLTTDIINFFDTERYNKGFEVYDHNHVSDFSALLKNKVELFRSWAQKKPIQIVDNITPGLQVKAHPGAVDRIINNLVENAIKHSPESTSVTVSLFQQSDHLHFVVANQGTPIPQHMVEKVFEPYFQIESQKTDGIGLGLSIVKKIVEDINGSIRIESENETRFIVTLPLHDGKQTAAKTSPADTITPSIEDYSVPDQPVEDMLGHPSNPHLLLVEDNVSMVHFLTTSLSGRYNIYVATSGEMALAKMEAVKNVDLIISDVMMSGMDGFAFCRRVVNDKRYEHIPFIFLSAKASAADKLSGLELGAIDYIEKPFSVTTLVSKVDSVLTVLRKQREIIDAPAASPSVPGCPTGPQFIANCERYDISKRQMDVIKLLLAGKSEQQIADILFIAKGTVSRHKTEIYQKVGVSNVAELIIKLCF